MKIILHFQSDLNTVSKYLKNIPNLSDSFNLLISGIYVLFEPKNISIYDKELKIYVKFEGYLSRDGDKTKLAGKTKMIFTGKRFLSPIGPISPEIIIINLAVLLIMMCIISVIPFSNGFWGWGVLSLIITIIFSLFIYYFFRQRLALYNERCELLKKNLMNIETSFNQLHIN